MSGVDWLVVLGGAAAIGWVNWYFFLAGARPASGRAWLRRRREGR